MGGQRAAIDITLEAVKEFQVVATGASAEFGRTAGGVVNVITKSGTNQVNGSAVLLPAARGADVEYVRRQAAHRLPSRAVRRNRRRTARQGQGVLLLRARRHSREPAAAEPVGGDRHAVPGEQPDARRQRSADQRQRRLSAARPARFLPAPRGQDEGQPVDHTINNNATARQSRLDAHAANNLSASYNFDYSKNTNQTFDVATYGNSANGTEGPSKINILNVNLFSTVTPNKLNEFHFTYSRENRPRSATPSGCPRTPAMGFAPDVPFRQPVLPRAERRRAREAVSAQGQLLDRQPASTRSRPAANGCTRTTPRSFAASSRAATCSIA